MYNNDQLRSLVSQLEVVVTTVKNDTSIRQMDLRRVLTFINKVIMVVDQAFQDVLVVFDSVRYLNDKSSAEEYDKIYEDIRALSARDRYRNVELICGRLSVLKERYQDEIRPIVETGAKDTQQWQELFWLIEDREGRIITMVQSLTGKISDDFADLSANRLTLKALKKEAGEKYDQIKSSIEELHKLNNKIMGFSGQSGLLMLTQTDSDVITTTTVFKPKNNPWISGSFYLIAAVIILGTLLIIGKTISPIYLPVIIIGGTILFSIVGATQLRNDDRLSEKSFLELMGLSFKQIPFLRDNKNKKE